MPRNKQPRREPSLPPDPRRAGPPEPPPAVAITHRPALIAGLCALLVIATIAAYWGLHASSFILLDDNMYVTENTHVQKGLSGETLAWAFTTMDQANWHPLTWISHLLDVRLFGMNPGMHHLTSLLLHAVNAVLLLLLLFRLTGALWRSAFVAALFALHPLHVESVAWIAERKDVLSTLFWMLTVFAWLAYVKSKKSTPYVLMVILYALGLMAKPMLVTLPFTLLLLDYWPLQRLTLPLRGRAVEIKKLLWEKAPLFAMAAASSVITVIAQQIGGAVKTITEFPLGQRVMNAAHAYVSYLGKMLWPSALSVYYPHPRAGLTAASAAAAFLVLAAVTVLIVRLGRRMPYLPFGWLWYLGTLVPVIGLVQVGRQAMADRYTYVPLIGIFIAATWGMAELAKNRHALRRAMAAAGVVLPAVLAVLTHAQAGYWTDSETLFGHALAVTSDNSVIHNNLGLVLLRKGMTREALLHYKEALRIVPGYSLAMVNVGFAYAKLGHPPEELDYLMEAVRRNPRFSEARHNLGNALSNAGRPEEAVEQYRQALQLKPDLAEASNNMGLELEKLNRMPEAINAFQEAIRLNPEYLDAFNNLGVALATTGRAAEAVEQYQRALGINPDSAMTLDNLGLALARLHRPEEALERFKASVKSDPDFADARINLGATLSQAGRTGEAAEQFRQALRIKPDSTQALDNLGVACWTMKQYPEAVECFGKAVRLNPDSAEFHYHLALALVQVHRPEEAREHFLKALQIRPDFPEARTGLENVEKALHAGRPPG